MADAQSNAPSIAQPMLQAMHATNATYATNARDQAPQRNPRLYNRARGAVDNSISAGEGTFFQSDIDLAVFLATRKPARVRHEKHRPRASERLAHEYDLETANHLSFIHGQQATQTETRNAS